MPERSTVSQVVQIGVESSATPGTAVTANRRLSSIDISPAVNVDIEMFRPSGNKFSTVQALNKEWAESSVEGQPSYNELQYLLASLLGTPTIAQVMDGATPTGVYEYTFAPNSVNDDTPVTFTIEKGSAVRAHRTTYGLVTEVGLEFSRGDVSLDGTIISRTITDGVTLATGATTPTLVPILPSTVDLFIDTTFGGLGTTKMLRAISVNPSIGDKYNPAWFLNSAEASFTSHVEQPVDATVEFVLEADSQGMTPLSYMRTGDTRFMRIQATGPQVYSGATPAGYRLRMDMAIKISDVAEFSDEDGVYAIGYTGTLVHDPGWNKALQVNLRNTMSTL